MAIEALLGSFSGLARLEVHTGEISLIDKASISHHGPTLRHLAVWSQVSDQLNSQFIYSIDEVASILGSCPELESITLSFCPIYLQSLSDEGKRFSIGHGTDLDILLVGTAYTSICHDSSQMYRKKSPGTRGSTLYAIVLYP
jgi:hypothetical protein